MNDGSTFADRVFLRTVKAVALILSQSDGMKTALSVLLAAMIIASVSCGERPTPEISLKGAVIRRDADPNKQAPIADVQVVAEYGAGKSVTYSSVQGAFTITLPAQSLHLTPVTLHFRHSGYEPLDKLAAVENDLYVIRMTPIANAASADTGRPSVKIANISVRYAAKLPVIAEVGTRVKTFQVVNRGNVPCDHRHGPCSPDGRWQAAAGTISLDAEHGNQFRNARLSCIAGPCPFTRIVRDNFGLGGRTISATVLNWSDTASFLIQAEVVHPMTSQSVRRSYPVIFDRTMNFSLPVSAEGICLEAEVNGAPIVFPLGPTLGLSWAECHEQTEPENSRIYRCELKPGYEFQ